MLFGSLSQVERPRTAVKFRVSRLKLHFDFVCDIGPDALELSFVLNKRH